MDESTPPNPADSGLEVRTSFVRNRNALLARADFGELFVDYYLHLGAHGLRLEPAIDALFKRALAAFTLHCASRPRNELTAWTVNFQEPLLNLFLAGDNGTGAVTGRAARTQRLENWVPRRAPRSPDFFRSFIRPSRVNRPP